MGGSEETWVDGEVRILVLPPPFTHTVTFLSIEPILPPPTSRFLAVRRQAHVRNTCGPVATRPSPDVTSLISCPHVLARLVFSRIQTLRRSFSSQSSPSLSFNPLLFPVGRLWSFTLLLNELDEPSAQGAPTARPGPQRRPEFGPPRVDPRERPRAWYRQQRCCRQLDFQRCRGGR